MAASTLEMYASFNQGGFISPCQCSVPATGNTAPHVRFVLIASALVLASSAVLAFMAHGNRSSQAISPSGQAATSNENAREEPQPVPDSPTLQPAPGPEPAPEPQPTGVNGRIGAESKPTNAEPTKARPAERASPPQAEQPKAQPRSPARSRSSSSTKPRPLKGGQSVLDDL